MRAQLGTAAVGVNADNVFFVSCSWAGAARLRLADAATRGSVLACNHMHAAICIISRFARY